MFTPLWCIQHHCKITVEDQCLPKQSPMCVVSLCFARETNTCFACVSSLGQWFSNLRRALLFPKSLLERSFGSDTVPRIASLWRNRGEYFQPPQGTYRSVGIPANCWQISVPRNEWKFNHDKNGSLGLLRGSCWGLPKVWEHVFLTTQLHCDYPELETWIGLESKWQCSSQQS